MSILSSFLVVTAVVAVAGRGEADGRDEPEAGLPPPARVKVNFHEHIEPIIEQRCLMCHGRRKLKGGLSLETREALLKGGEDGPAAVVGKSAESLLVQLAAGLEEGRRMPSRGRPLTTEQLGLLRAWIDQGLAWPEGFSFGFPEAALAPRTPEVPAAPEGLALTNPLDRFVAKSLADRGVRIDWTPVSDRVFARRASIDLIGLLPMPEQVSKIGTGDSQAARANYVESLLANRRAYAEHWISFWNDALCNAYRGTGFIDGGRKTITYWLFQALYENRGYDRMVHDLVSPVPGSEGFTKGIVWRGVVNASQAPPMQTAQNVAQVFLGTNLKCASCHDSFVNHWRLADAYALASVFADQALELHRCDKPLNKTSSIGFIYPELGDVDDKAPRSERMDQLADLLVTPKNGRFARTIVNRLWAQLMGRGIIEPLDDTDQKPWNQDLLDWLAADFVAHGHDLKHTLGLIASSRAYQLPSVNAKAPDPNDPEPFVFNGPIVKRMTAEQFVDALSTVTGVWPKPTGAMLMVDDRGQGGQVAEAEAVIKATESPENPKSGLRVLDFKSQWIWSHANAQLDPGGRILLRKTFQLDRLPSLALIAASCDDEVVLYVNGRKVGESHDWAQPVSAEITTELKLGENVIAAEATNWPDPKHNRGAQHKNPNPAGLIVRVLGSEPDQADWTLGTDASWLWTVEADEGWNGPGFDVDGWRHAFEQPWAVRAYANVNLAAALGDVMPTENLEPIRAALLFDDPLLSALGRSNRAHVVTRRDSAATMLQALELINGVTLDAKLKQGAAALLAASGNGADADTLIARIFLAALDREPTPEERDTARDLVGTPVKAEGVQDLLWTIVMLPEFQLVY